MLSPHLRAGSTLATPHFRFCRFPEIKTLEDNERFCSFLRTLLDDQCVYVASLDHYPRFRSAVIIPNLSLGLSLSSPHLSPDQLDAFMRRMLVSRISRRVLAEHHLALSDSVTGRDHGSSEEERHVGIIYTGLNVEKSVRRCTALLNQLNHDSDVAESSNSRDIRWPKVVIEGHAGTQFAYIREHLESALSIPVLTFP
jgi:pyruvate dehydrogenase kinase 2/3/4